MDKFRLVKVENHCDNSTKYYFEQAFSLLFWKKNPFWFQIRVGGYYFYKDYSLALNILSHLRKGTLIEHTIIQ